MTRKWNRTATSQTAQRQLVAAVVDFIESMPTQPSPLEERRQAILEAADKAGYRHSKG